MERDVPLLREIAAKNSVFVSIKSTLDASLARKLEPRAPRPELRLKAVRALREAGIRVGVNPNPIMPLITDQEEKLDKLAKAARDHGAIHFGGGLLFLMPCARRVFFPFLAANFPHLLRRYEERYEKDAYLRGPYKETVQKKIAAIRAKYGLDASRIHREVAATSDRDDSDAAQGLLFS